MPVAPRPPAVPLPQDRPVPAPEATGARPLTAVFDIGKTNKKFFLFDAAYREVYREYTTLPLTEDEDGHPTEDLAALRRWLLDTLHRVLDDEAYDVRAVNFSSYGASLVHLDAAGRVLTPLYNYTKPLDPALEDAFYATHGPEVTLATRTGSTRAGLLNAGLQLYWLKHRRPEVFARIRYSLHLPQYLSYLLTGVPVSDYTSLGCHTALWDYATREYHDWVDREGLRGRLASIVPTDTSLNISYRSHRLRVGVGIHDSSAALLPYLRGAAGPFVLVSTGTWSVSLNPFATAALTANDLAQGCIHYLRPDGLPVRAARLFLGHDYQQAVAALATRFGVGEDRHRAVRFDPAIHRALLAGEDDGRYETAYHRLLTELVDRQVTSTRAAIGATPVRTLFVDGGFSGNNVYLALLAHHFRDLEVRTTDASLGSALGAALVLDDGPAAGHVLETHYAPRRYFPFSSTNATDHVSGL